MLDDPLQTSSRFTELIKSLKNGANSIIKSITYGKAESVHGSS